MVVFPIVDYLVVRPTVEHSVVGILWWVKTLSPAQTQNKHAHNKSEWVLVLLGRNPEKPMCSRTMGTQI